VVTKVFYIGPNDTVAFAAAELKRVLGCMDPELEIALCAMERKGDNAGYWLGTCNALAVEGPEVENTRLDDGYLIQTHGAAGIIAGVNPRSLLLAVYRYLRELGCVWIRPGAMGEIIPKNRISQQEVNVCEAAAYRHRGVCIEGAVNYDHVVEMIKWLPKIGMNAYFNQFWTPFTFYDNWYRHVANPMIPASPVTREEVDGFVRDQMQDIRHQDMLYHAAGHGWTCAPFGLDSCGWYPFEGELPEGMSDLLALVDGKRELYKGIPLNTNLCYTNPVVKEKIIGGITQYCLAHPEVDFLHFWLADAMNNQCECAQCIQKRPADHYVDLLNALDERMTEAGVNARVVFLIYFDLMWSPVQSRLKNPDRFVLMFAPISRTYSTAYTDGGIDEEKETLPFAYNKLKLPRSVAENVAFLRDWQKIFQGDSFIYDYHLWRDYTLDAGFAQIAKVLFRDMVGLRQLGINGMISCQSQRVFFPSPLPMLLMADALWDNNSDYEACVNRHYTESYGALGSQVRVYLEELSALMDSPYMRREKKAIDEDARKSFARADAHIRSFLPVIEQQLCSTDTLSPALRRSFEILKAHAELCLLLVIALQFKASGEKEKAVLAWEDTSAYARTHEMAFNEVFDASVFLSCVGGSIQNDESSQA